MYKYLGYLSVGFLLVFNMGCQQESPTYASKIHGPVTVNSKEYYIFGEGNHTHFQYNDTVLLRLRIKVGEKTRNEIILGDTNSSRYPWIVNLNNISRLDAYKRHELSYSIEHIEAGSYPVVIFQSWQATDLVSAPYHPVPVVLWLRNVDNIYQIRLQVSGDSGVYKSNWHEVGINFDISLTLKNSYTSTNTGVLLKINGEVTDELTGSCGFRSSKENHWRTSMGLYPTRYDIEYDYSIFINDIKVSEVL